MFGLHIPRLFPFAKSKGTFREYDILKTRRGAVRDLELLTMLAGINEFDYFMY